MIGIAFVDLWDFIPRLSKARIRWEQAMVTHASDFKQVPALNHAAPACTNHLVLNTVKTNVHDPHG